MHGAAFAVYALLMADAKYQIVANESYFEDAFVHYRRQIRWVRWAWIAGWILAPILGVAAAAKFASTGSAVGFVPFAFVLFSLLASRIDRWRVRRHARRLPQCGHLASITLSDEGMSSSMPHADGQLKWQSFSKARRFRDGLMLFIGPRMYQWLPDAAAETGAAEIAEQLARKNVSDFRLMP